MKIIDAIGVVLIVVGILMTVLTIKAARQSFAAANSFTLHEIPPPAPPAPGGNI